MLDSYPITEYYGFTEDEVRGLCEEYDMDFDTVKTWYNGYLIDGMHMYNPNSVCCAIENDDYDSYWKNTSSFASINTFITLNYEGLKDDILNMLPFVLFVTKKRSNHLYIVTYYIFYH